MDYPKKIRTGVGLGDSDMEFQGVLKKQYVELPRVN